MATNQLSEQEIQFRKRARRRLVGAIALVLLMVTVLPMILDDREVKPVPQDIAITIPSQDGGSFTSRIVPAAPETPQPAANMQLASPLEKPNPIDTAKPNDVASPPAETAKPDAAPHKTPEPLAQAVTPEQQTADKAKPVKSVEPVKAKPPVAAAKPATKKGAFSIQVGVFTEGPKFKELEGKLVAQGLHPSTEKIDTPKGQKLRLRVGAYASRTEAEAALDKLKSAGLGGMIVANK